MRYLQYEMVLKRVRVSEDTKPYYITQSDDVYEFARNVIHMDEFAEERFYVVCLNNKGSIIGFSEISKGTVGGSMAHPRDVFKAALAMNASSVIALHNHPSGETTPSGEDITTTKRLAEAGEILGVKLLDHIIIGNGYKSLAGEGGLL